MEDEEVVEVVVVVSVVAEVAEAVEVVDLEGDEEEEGEEVDLEEDEVVEASPKAQVNSASFHVQSPGLQSRLGNIAHYMYVIFNLVCNWLIQRVCKSENISFKFGISLQLQKEQYKISREKRRPLARMIETR